jgi:hypothetical protein
MSKEIVIPASETFSGAGAGSTVLRQTVYGHNLLRVSGDNTLVENLTLDTQTNNGGIAFQTGASNVTLENADVMSGNVPGHFAIYFAGPRGATVASPRYSTGNRLQNVNVSDRICDDGVSWSYQRNDTITNVSETGSRLALYVDTGVVVNGYRYTPGPCISSDDGFWITPPSSNIVISNFVSSGAGGYICPNIAMQQSCSRITLENERAAAALHIGNVTGLRVSGSAFHAVIIDNTTLTSGVWTRSSPATATCHGGRVAIAGLLCQ